jgi:hypothetical protein
VVTGLNWFGLLRTYSLHQVNSELFQPLPPEIEIWVDARVRNEMKHKQLSPIQITFRAKEFQFERVILVNVTSGYADVLIYSNSRSLPVDLFLSTWGFINEEVKFNFQGQEVSLHSLWNDAIREVIGAADPRSLEGAAFGCIALMRRTYDESVGDFDEEFDDEISISDSLRLTGIKREEMVHIERNSLVVLTQPLENYRDESPWGYILLAGLFSRNRLISDQIIRRATEVSNEINQKSKRRVAEVVLAQSAQVQQFGIQSRAWTQGASYLGNPHLVSIFNKVGGLATLGEMERENQKSALEGLDRFANGLSGAMTARSQRRLNSVGFVVAIFSLLLSGINVTYLATAKTDPRMWVFGTWAFTLLFIIGSLSFTVWISRGWTSSRSSNQSD